MWFWSPKCSVAELCYTTKLRFGLRNYKIFRRIECRLARPNRLMTEPIAKETILNTTLPLLVQLGLTSAEIAALRLSHLHLAGKEPNIQLTLEGQTEPKIVQLNLEAHRLLVSWLVARPDSVTDFLFPGQENKGMTATEIEQAVSASKKTAPPHQVDDSMSTQPARTPPSPPPPPSFAPSRPITRAVRPLTRPEIGAPPPGLKNPTPSIKPEIFPVAHPSDSVLPTQKIEQTAEVQPTEENKLVKPIESSIPKETKVLTEEKISESPVVPVSGQVKSPQKKQLTAQEAAQKSNRQWLTILIPLAAILAMMVCVLCTGSGFLAWQLMPLDTLTKLNQFITPQTDEIAVASVTPKSTATGSATPENNSFAIPTTYSPLPTPSPIVTPSVSATMTPLPPTDTATAVPVPTDTVAPTAPLTPTVALTPTETATNPPPPTNTSAQTNTPVPNTPVPAVTRTPMFPSIKITATLELLSTPKPEVVYAAPVLLGPKNDANFNKGNMIEFRWQPVAELAENEYYAVRVSCQFQNKERVEGSNVKEPQWTMPPELFSQVDGPENRYQWYVIIERNGKPASPKSEVRTFIWK